MRRLDAISVMLLLTLALAPTPARAQSGEIRLPLIARDSTGSLDTVFFGVHPLASRCIDDQLGEWEIPPDVCCGWHGGLCVGLVDPPIQALDCLGGGVRLDLRRFWSSTQADTFCARFCGVDPIVFRWPPAIALHFDSCRARDPFGGMLIDVDMRTVDSLLIPRGLTSFLIFTYGPRGTTGLSAQERIPTMDALSQNHPNPFNPSTTITYRLARASHVSLVVFDVLGREVLTLLGRSEEPGVKQVRLNAGALPAGVYFYRLMAGGFVETRKMVVQK
ncbi:MAG: T9SS type A sorting domain-containing protein [Bacteroidota bacterium]